MSSVDISECSPRNDNQSDSQDWFLEADLNHPGLDIEKIQKCASGLNNTPFVW